MNTGKFAIILSQCYNAHTRVKLVELLVIACFAVYTMRGTM